MIELRKPDGTFDDGTLSFIKWLAIISMLVDHINILVLLPMGLFRMELYCFGRLAAPLFAIMVGYNLARPATGLTTQRQRAGRMLKWLAVFAVISEVVCQLVRPPDYPLNILFGLLAGACTVYFILRIRLGSRPAWAKTALYTLVFVWFCLAGSLAEYGFSVTGTLVLAYLLASASTKAGRVVLALMMLGSLYTFALTNGNHYAMLAVPVLALALCCKMTLQDRTPRFFFYAFYPAHIALLGWLGLSLAST